MDFSKVWTSNLLIISQTYNHYTKESVVSGRHRKVFIHTSMVLVKFSQTNTIQNRKNTNGQGWVMVAKISNILQCIFKTFQKNKNLKTVEEMQPIVILWIIGVHHVVILWIMGHNMLYCENGVKNVVIFWIMGCNMLLYFE